ncbi:MAG: aldo/keto reductase [Actinobacteria bacterium HGW-Actinobacteria-10]|jgi:diketogulonate reductase-like aldo/keto reductase|nr:MAG: aldo/keto reductase [Actinobacteria bacterium HGW-Actinobacteria-10]
MRLDITSTVTLANGVEMPRFGLGTYKAAEGREVESEVAVALEAGYRAIDTASLYGNEAGIGRAIASSGIARKEIFLTTKVWNDEQGYESTLEAFDRSLERLRTDYVDLYLVHWPIARHYAATWRAMEEILESGRTRAIGVCNFLTQHLDALEAVSQVRPMVNQVELHPRLQQPELQAYCHERHIVQEAWAPIMRGRVFDIPEIVEIGRSHSKSAAQIAIRWVLQSGHVVIPKSVHAERIRENADVFDFELSEAEMAVILSLDRGERIGKDPDEFVLS